MAALSYVLDKLQDVVTRREGGAHIGVVRQREAGLELDPFVGVRGTADVGDALEVQLFLDAHLAHHIHLRM